MKYFLKFWQKDIINKLIVLAFLGVAGGFLALVVLFANMPAGKSLTGALGDYFPTSTLEPRVILTRSAAQALTQSVIETASVPPTITTMPFTPFMATSTPLPASVGQLNATLLPATATLVLPTPTQTPIPPTATPTHFAPTPTLVANHPTPGAIPSPTRTFPQSTGIPLNLACIPSNPPQKGKVLSVIDGNTVKVLIDGFAYVVRYIGIQVPANKNYALLASNTNGDLVFAEEVTLIPDVLDKDPAGHLLRYLKVGDMLPSIELLKKGLATAVDTPPNSACAQAFKDAEKFARNAQIGIWLPAPTLP
jgi:endonuclease YncB( thermonuclease family)